MSDHLLSVLPFGVLIICTLFLLFSIAVEPKCKRCKTPMQNGEYDDYGVHFYCPNPKCKRFGVESYE